MKREIKERFEALDNLVLRYDGQIFFQDWDFVTQCPSFELRELAALSVNLNLDFANVEWAKKFLEFPSEDELIFLDRQLEELRKNISDDGRLDKFIKRATIASRSIAPYGDLPVLQKNDNPYCCEIKLTDFRAWAKQNHWDLPDQFPSQKAISSKKAFPADTPKGVTVNIPHLTKQLEGLFKIMRANWTDYDPKNPPKQVNIAEEIDKELGWQTCSDGRPSRNATVLATLIRPDHLKEVDRRNKKS